MPVVPRYNPTVQSNALPAARQSGANSDIFQPSGAAGRLAQGMGELANAVDQIEERRDTTEFLNLETQLNNQYLLQASEMKKSRIGVNAYGVTKDVDTMLDETVRKLGEGTKSNRVRTLLQQSAMKLRQSAFRDFDAFENTQTKAAEDAAFEANIGMIKDRVSLNPSPDAVALGEKEILQRNTAYGVQRGWSPEVLAAKNDADISGLHVNAIRVLLNDNPQIAEAYYESNKDKIRGTEQDDVEKLLKPVMLEYKAEQARDYVIGAGMDEESGRKWIMDNYTGQEETKALSSLNLYFTEQKAAVAAKEKEFVDNAWKMVASGQPIPRDVWATLDGKTQIQIQDYRRVAAERAEARAKGNQDKVKTDWNRYIELRNLALTDPKAFKAVNLQGELANFAPTELKQLVELQGKNEQQVKSAATVTQQISATATSLKIKDANKGMFESAVYSEIERIQQDTGKELSFDERQKVIDRMAMEGEIPGVIFDTNVRGYEVYGTPDATKFVPSDDSLTKRFFDRKGRMPTKEELKTLKQQLSGK